MRALLHGILIALFACSLTACGIKGKLKTPTQVQLEEQKKARKAAKKAADEVADEDTTDEPAAEKK